MTILQNLYIVIIVIIQDCYLQMLNAISRYNLYLIQIDIS